MFFEQIASECRMEIQQMDVDYKLSVTLLQCAFCMYFIFGGKYSGQLRPDTILRLPFE